MIKGFLLRDQNSLVYVVARKMKSNVSVDKPKVHYLCGEMANIKKNRKNGCILTIFFENRITFV